MASRKSKTWMWAEAVELIERTERLHQQFFQRLISPREPTWVPPIDMFETDYKLSIVIALPGVPPDQMHVTLDAGLLVVTGTRPLPTECRTATINRLEIPQGHFERRIELPPGRFEFERQELKHGCLVLLFNKM